MGRKRKDVVREPDVIGPVTPLHEEHFLGYGPGGASVIAVAVDGLRAPVTAKRTAAARNQIEGEVAMRGRPCASVRVYVDQIPGGRGQPVEVFEQRAWPIESDSTMRSGSVYKTGDVFDGSLGCQFNQRLFHLAQNDVIEPVIQVFDRVIRCVRTVHRRPAAGSARQSRQLERQLAISNKAHLGEKVKVVLADHKPARTRAPQRL